MSNLLIYVDTETTGKDTSNCGMSQLSAIIVREGEEVSRFNIDINPYTYNRPISVSKKALEVTNKTDEELRSYPSASLGFIQFITWMNANRKVGEYYTLVAYRTLFDLEVLQGLFEDQRGDARGIYDYFHYKHLDILQLVLFMGLYGLLAVKNHKLETLCNSYGIGIKAHNSMSDIEATRKLHKKLMAALGLPFSKINKV